MGARVEIGTQALTRMTDHDSLTHYLRPGDPDYDLYIF